MYYCGYVDDTFSTIQKDKVNKFHQHLNNILHQLDLLLNMNTTTHWLSWMEKKTRYSNSHSRTVFKKLTPANRYLHFTSHHSKHQKLAISKTLHDRIDTHVTNKFHKYKLHKQLQSTLLLNEFLWSCLVTVLRNL